MPLPSAEFSRRLVDVESIEVQRGPSGTAQGRFNLGGTISVRTRQPDNTFRGEVQGTFGDRGQRGTGLSLGGPIVPDAVFGRAYLDYYRRDGSINDATGKDIDDLESYNGGGSVRLQRDSSLSVTFAADTQQDHVGAYAFLPFDAFRSRSLGIQPPNDERRRAHGFSGTIDYDMGPARLTSFSAWRSYTVSSRQDLAYSPMAAMFGGGRTFSDEDGWQASQEIRLSSPRGASGLRWTVGAYYQRDRVDYDYIFDMPAFGPASRYVSRYDREEIAGFGEATVALPLRFELTGGLRVAHDRDRLDNNNPFRDTTDATLVTPRIQLAWRPDAERMLYVSATRGARAGGFSRLAADPAPYDPEYLWQYEAGFRSTWFDRRLGLNAALFHIDWTDQQVTQIVGAGQTRTTNAGRSTSQGLEVEAVLYPAEGLEASARLGLIEARYDRYVNASGQDLSGKRLVNTPSATVGASLQYRRPLDPLPFALLLRGDYELVGGHYFDPENRLRQDAFSLLNLRVGLENERVSASLFVRNALDTRYRAYGFTDSFGHDVAIAGDRRLVGAVLKVKF